MNYKTGIAMLFCVLMLSSTAVNALTIKLGSIAPNGSPWDNALRKMAAEWASLSNGKVKLKIYPGGIAGDEPDRAPKAIQATSVAIAIPPTIPRTKDSAHATIRSDKPPTSIKLAAKI